MNRRTFLQHTATAGLSLGLATGFSSIARAALRSPGNRLRVAIAGTNSRGIAHIQCLAAVPNVEIAYICDVDEKALAKGMAEAARWNQSPKGIRDFRHALDDRDVDALTIATPDHWHAPMAILALAAGKHVFVEKPCSHNPREGELLVLAAEKYGRLAQMGNQRRSFPAMQEAIAKIHGGIIGRAYTARGWYANRRGSIGRGKSVAVPATLDYDLWQGPAPRQPYRDNLIHYNWHWFWHWGTGEALNNGTHEIDVARWALGVDHAETVVSTGGRFQFQDDWETPDTQQISWQFPGGKSMTWEGRSCNDFPVDGRARGVMVYGSEGSVLLDGSAYTIYDRNNKIVMDVKDTQPVDSTNTVSSTGLAHDTLHFKNFADAIRDGATLNAPVAEANKSVTMLQLGNIAQRVGRSLRCDPATARIIGDPDAMQLWQREYAAGWEPVI